jgi:hypothetical protein
MIDLTQERDVDTLRQLSLLLDREVQRLITKNLQLTTELARLRGVADPEQLALAEVRALEQRRAQVLTPPAPSPTPSSRPPRPGHGPRISEDPMGIAGGLNLYRYVDNAPSRWRDPLGWCPDSNENETQTPGPNETTLTGMATYYNLPGSETAASRRPAHAGCREALEPILQGLGWGTSRRPLRGFDLSYQLLHRGHGSIASPPATRPTLLVEPAALTIRRQLSRFR